MLLYVKVETDIKDVYIDYLEVKLKDGQEVSLNWDESEISRKVNGFEARYKGVCFGEEYANGRINDLKDCKVIDVGLYSEMEGNFYFRITDMLFVDGDNNYAMRGIDYFLILESKGVD